MGALHVGNVVEFNIPSLVDSLDEEVRAKRVVGCDEYGSMAPFYSSDPGVVVVPCTAQLSLDRWSEVQASVLGWTSFDPVAFEGDSRMLCDNLERHPAVGRAIAGGATVIPWGETPAFREFVKRTGSDATLSDDESVAGRLESKLHQGDVLRSAAMALGSPPWLTIPEETVVTTDEELVTALVGLGDQGAAAVVKSPVGVGGSGVVVLMPNQTATRSGAIRALASARAGDGFIGEPPLIVQRYYRPSVTAGDLTIDFEVTGSGEVVHRGSARMLMDGTHYRGAVTETRLVAGGALEHLERFGREVGDRVATDGYRGWFDIDLISTPAGTLVPVEINARRTGPTVALTIRERVRELTGAPVEVAAHDMLELPVRMDARTAVDHFAKAVAGLGLDGQVVPTLTTATESPTPYLGVATSGGSAQEAAARLAAISDALLTGTEGP